MRTKMQIDPSTTGAFAERSSTFRDRSIRLLALSTLLITQTFCQPARFQEFAGSHPDPGQSSNNPEKPTRVFETHASVPRTRALDVTWVIDNSASMTEEAAHVKKNFAAFIETIRTESDLKVALISREGNSSRDMRLPVSGPNYRQINRTVESTDSLEITASVFCPAVPLAGGMCERLRKNALTNLDAIAGSLKGFLRQNSKKAFVFVTDDRSRVPAASFLSAFAETFPGDQPVVYGFIGVAKDKSPCAASVGTQYMDLATKTTGAVFNICDRDWAPAFRQLANHIVRVTRLTIPVPEELKNGSAIQSVELNGKFLQPSEYEITTDGLMISSDIVGNALEITVRIQYQVP